MKMKGKKEKNERENDGRRKIKTEKFRLASSSPLIKLKKFQRFIHHPLVPNVETQENKGGVLERKKENCKI